MKKRDAVNIVTAHAHTLQFFSTLPQFEAAFLDATISKCVPLGGFRPAVQHFGRLAQEHVSVRRRSVCMYESVLVFCKCLHNIITLRDVQSRLTI